MRPSRPARLDQPVQNWALDPMRLVGALLVGFAAFAYSNAPPGIAQRVQGDGPWPFWTTAIWVAGYGASLLVCLARPWSCLRLAISAPSFVALVLLAALTAQWSINPIETLKAAIGFGATTAGGIALGLFCLRRQAQLIAAVLGLLAIASLLLIVLYPAWGQHRFDEFDGAWRGLWFQKNGFAQMMVVGISACLGIVIAGPEAGEEPRSLRVWALAGAALFAFLVIGSTSKTGLLGMTAAMATAAMIAFVRSGPVSMAATLYAGIVMSALLTLGVFLFPNLAFKLVGREASLTGRTDIWAEIELLSRSRFWTGFGYGAFWLAESAPLATITTDLDFQPASAHNSWTDLSIHFGLPGVLLVALGFCGIAVRAALRLARDPAAAYPLILLTGLLAMSATETMFAEKLSIIWMAIVAIGVRLARAPQTL